MAEFSDAQLKQLGDFLEKKMDARDKQLREFLDAYGTKQDTLQATVNAYGTKQDTLQATVNANGQTLASVNKAVGMLVEWA
jgi:uncharacterized protein YlxW (UPF0749 family)